MDKLDKLKKSHVIGKLLSQQLLAVLKVMRMSQVQGHALMTRGEFAKLFLAPLEESWDGPKAVVEAADSNSQQVESVRLEMVLRCQVRFERLQAEQNCMPELHNILTDRGICSAINSRSNAAPAAASIR